jgi:uncharacterized protein (TIGR02246 family)
MIRLISACCLLLLVACGTPREPAAGEAAGGTTAMADPAADEAAIRTLGTTWFTAYNAGNADSVAALYAEDGVISAPGAPPARGAAAIREFLTKDIAGAKEGGLTLTPATTSEIGASGDLGWEWNTFKVTDKSGKTVDTGKYVTVFGRKNGKWLILRDIWNSDNPPAPAAATAAN